MLVGVFEDGLYVFGLGDYAFDVMNQLNYPRNLGGIFWRRELDATAHTSDFVPDQIRYTLPPKSLSHLSLFSIPLRNLPTSPVPLGQR